MSGPALGPTKRPIQWAARFGTQDVKWPEREAKLLLPSSVQIKSEWRYTSPPPLLRTIMACAGTLLFNIKPKQTEQIRY